MPSGITALMPVKILRSFQSCSQWHLTLFQTIEIGVIFYYILHISLEPNPITVEQHLNCSYNTQHWVDEV